MNTQQLKENIKRKYRWWETTEKDGIIFAEKIRAIGTGGGNYRWYESRVFISHKELKMMVKKLKI